MYKQLIAVVTSIILLAGCMPAPITETKESKIEQNMIIRSLASVGNTYRVNQKIKAAKKGEKTVIAYAGTSTLTQDKENDISAAKKSFDLITETFGKKANTEYINFNLYAADSFIGNLAFTENILSKNPDIIFLDFAVFDSSKPDCRESFESIVRTCLADENRPQIVILLNSNANGLPKQDFMEQIAKYYNLPVINVATAVQPEFSSGRMQKNTFYTDENNITAYGKETLAKFCENYIKQSSKDKKDKNYTVPSPMYTNGNIENIKYLSVKNIETEDIDNQKSFEKINTDNKIFKEKISFSNENKKNIFLFKIKADNIWLILPVSTDREDIAEIYINGKKHKEINPKENSEKDIIKAFKIYSSDTTEEVAVGIKIKEQIQEEEDKSTIETILEKDIKAEQEEDITEQNKKELKDFEFFGIAYTAK